MRVRYQNGPLQVLLLTLAVILGTGCAQQRDPQTVVMVIESSPISLDPRVGTDAQSERIGELIFDSLLRRDQNSNLIPALAERWEVLDPLNYVFHLRNDVRFHDGRPLTARDVRYTFESLLSGEITSPKSSSYARIESIDAPDDHTVKITLTEAYASFLWNLTQGAIGIVPEGSGEGLRDSPVGSGPFRFVRAGQDEGVVLERNPNYWGRAPNIAGIEFRVVPDATTRALELRKGSADIALNSLTADMVRALEREPSLVVTQAPGNSYQYIGMNLERPNLSRPVRQAIAYSINREDLIRYLWSDLVRPADSILPPQHWAHASDLLSYPHDPDRARDLLDQAGLTPGNDGIRLRIEMKTSTDQTGRELAAVLQDQLAQVGIALEIRSFEFATFYADIIKGNFDIYSLRWAAGNDDPDIFEYCFASSKFPPNGANRGRYSNPEVDRLIDLGRSSTDTEARREAYVEVQHILNQDLPYVHLWNTDNVAVHNRRISNLHPFPNGNYDFLTEIEAAPIAP